MVPGLLEITNDVCIMHAPGLLSAKNRHITATYIERLGSASKSLPIAYHPLDTCDFIQLFPHYLTFVHPFYSLFLSIGAGHFILMVIKFNRQHNHQGAHRPQSLNRRVGHRVNNRFCPLLHDLASAPTRYVDIHRQLFRSGFSPMS